MPYNKETGIITRPVNTRDIGMAIGSGSNDVGKLCTHVNINKWAKYKPIAFWGLMYETGKNAPSSSPGKDYWKGYSQNNLENLCGMNIPVAVNDMGSQLDPDSFMHKLAKGETIWEYVRPRGAAEKEYYRMLDFDGYIDKNHGKYLRPYVASEPEYEVPVGGHITPKIIIPQNGEYVLSLADFELKNYQPSLITYNLNFSEMYLGLLCKKEGSNTFNVYFSDERAGIGEHEVPCVSYDEEGVPKVLTTGTWHLAPFLYTKEDADSGDQIFIGLDGIVKDTYVHLLSGLVVFYFSYTFNKSTGVISTGIELDNDTGARHVIRRVAIRIKASVRGASEPDPEVYFEQVWENYECPVTGFQPFAYPEFNLNEAQFLPNPWRDLDWWVEVETTETWSTTERFYNGE